MASGFFALLDDIAVLMDDVAVLGKIATKKTAGILGDDLAVNAEKATGFVSSREIPVLWAITKGSFINKLIIVPIVLLLNIFLAWLIKYILIIGGVFVHKIESVHHFLENLQLPSIIKEFLVGLLVGVFTVVIVEIIKKIISSKSNN